MKLKKYFSIVTLIISIIDVKAQTGLIDPSFVIGTGPDATVLAITQQTTGDILLGGGFATVNGVSASRVARLNSTGSVDNTFGGFYNNAVYKIKTSSTGKIYMGGQFTSFSSTVSNRILRLNSDGTKDATFSTNPGANAFVYSLDEQADGKIVLGGGFTSFGGVARSRIARSNTNGTNDATFSIGTGFNNSIYSIKIQSDGKILAGGIFTTFNGSSASRLVRLNSSGTIDNSFIIGTGITHTGTLTPTVFDIEQLPDGKIIVSGTFSFYNGNSVSNIVRLNTDGTIDNTFASNTFNSVIRNVEIQSNGKLLVMGQFTTVNGVSKNRIVRLNADGTVDNTFGGTGTNGDIITGTFQTDGNLLIGGTFTTYSGNTSNCIARVLMNCQTVTLTTSSTNNICFGQSNGSATITASGGNSFTYSWTPSISSSSVASSLAAGTYSYIVTNECGSSTSSFVTITQPAILPVAISGSSMVCSGSEATLTASGATSYTWSTSQTGSVINPSPTVQTNYTVTGSDINGCTNTAVHTISISGVCATANVPCGLVVSNLNYPIYASVVSGATQYRFRFYNSTTNVLLATKINPTRLLTLNSVSGIYYGNTYKITVAVNQGFGFGPESSMSCLLTINPPSLTVPCSNTVTNLSTPVLSSSADGISAYLYKFYNNTTGALVATKTFTNNYLYLNQISGINYGNSYKYTVEGQYFNGTSNVFTTPSSSLCVINIAPPQSKVPCGKTYPNGNSYSTATAVSGATGYRISFYAQSTGSLVATKTFTSNYIYFSQVSGLIFNKSYFWTVECEYNNGSGNVFGPASTNTCTMVWGQPLSITLNDNPTNNYSNNLRSSNLTYESIDKPTVLFPNPTSGIVTVETEADIEHVTVQNVTGQILNIPLQNFKLDLTVLDSGIYFITVFFKDNKEVFRIIKEK